MTGYTCGVVEGTMTTLAEFAKTCALAYFRDLSKLPTKFEPDVKWHYEQIKAAETSLARLQKLTTKAKQEAYGLREHKKLVTHYEEALAEKKVVAARINAMLEKVEAWKVKKALKPLRQYMIEQLQGTLKMDGDTRYAESWLANIIDTKPIVYYRNAVQAAKADIKYHKKQIAEEEKMARSTNAWLTELTEYLSKK